MCFSLGVLHTEDHCSGRGQGAESLPCWWGVSLGLHREPSRPVLVWEAKQGLSARHRGTERSEAMSEEALGFLLSKLTVERAHSFQN